MRKQNNKIKFNPNDQVEVRSIVKDSLEKVEARNQITKLSRFRKIYR